MQIQGHTLEEQDELSADFQDMIVRSLHHVVDEIALKVARESMGRTGLIAAGPADDVIALWEDEVPELIAYLDGVYDAGALEAAAEMAAGLPVPNGQGIPGVPDAFVLEYLQQASNRLKGVGDELWENIRDEILIGLENGETTDQIAGRIRAAAGFTEARAKTIARTELVGASNAGTHAQVLMIVPDAKKEWVATTDGRTRFTHRHADGQKVPVDQAFIVGGSTLRWPGDPGGAAGEVVNCRCTLIFDVDEDTEPALTCDPNAVTALMSALVNMPGSSCTCAVTLPSGGATGLPTNLTQSQHDEIYSAFMNPDPISPAYGGAKIYKKLVAAKAKLAADAPELAGLSEHQILAVVDEIYKGKKFTFTEKFDEWLPTAAGKKAAPHVNIPSPGTHATPPPISHTIPTPATVAPKLPPIKKLPKPSELTYTGKTLGSHGAQVWTDADGGKWLFKPQKDFMTDLDTAVAKIQSKAKHTRTGTYEITLNGKKGSIQYMYDGSSDAFPGGSFDPTKLSPADLHAMQQEQIFDWMVSNFDTHSGQWIRLPDGQLVSVDKGQAFKFFGNDKLDWNYVPVTPLGNDKLTYSQLWKAFIDGKVDLNDPTIGDLGQFIDDLMSIPDAEYRALLKPYVDNLGLLPPKFHNADELLDAMVARKNNLKKDFSAYWAKAQKEKAKHSLPSGPTTPSTPTPTPPVTSVIPPPPGPVAPSGAIKLNVNEVFAELFDVTKKDGDVVAYGTHKITGVKFRLVKKTSVTGQPYMDMEQWGDSTHKWHDMSYPVKNPNSLDTFSTTIDWESAPHPSPLSVPTPSSPPVVTVTPPATPSTLTTAQKNVLLQLMKDPQPITPGWGGAKVYKQLATIKAKAAGNPAFTGMSDKDILKAIDEVAPHATAKTYESVVTDWLNTPAGKKYAGGGPEVLDNPGPGAVVTPPSTPSPIPTPTTPSLSSPDLLNTSTYNDLQIFAKTGDTVSPDDVWKAYTNANDGDILAVVQDSTDVHVLRVKDGKLYFSTKSHGGGYLYDVEVKTPEQLKKLKSYYGYGDWKTPKGTSLPDGSASIPSVPVKKTVPTPSATSTLDAADTILTADNDITKYSLTQHMDVLAAFKDHSVGSYLTDTPEQIFEHLQQTLLQLKTNPSYQNMTMMQLVKMIDEAGAKKMGVANKHLFETKIRDYLKTPSGKAHAAKPVKKAAKKAAKKVAKKATPSYSTPTTPSTPGTKPPTPDLSPNVQSTSPTSSRPYDSIYHNEVMDMFHEMMNGQGAWSASQKSSLRYYSSNAGYTAMNKCLRGLSTCSPAVLKHIKQAQLGMRRSTRNMILRRGTNADEFPGFARSATFDQLETLKGRRLKADSFLSTSYGDRPAFGGNVMIEFEAPAGTPFAYVGRGSDPSASSTAVSHYPGENELILGAGLEYEVISVTKLSSYQTLVRVRIIVP